MLPSLRWRAPITQKGQLTASPLRCHPHGAEALESLAWQCPCQQHTFTKGFLCSLYSEITILSSLASLSALGNPISTCLREKACFGLHSRGIQSTMAGKVLCSKMMEQEAGCLHFHLHTGRRKTGSKGRLWTLKPFFQWNASSTKECTS